MAEFVNARRGRPTTDSVLVRHRQLVIDAYNRGGLNTFCWHADNYVTARNFYDTTAVVKTILPGTQHAAYLRDLAARQSRGPHRSRLKKITAPDWFIENLLG